MWAPTSKQIDESRRVSSEFLFEKTGLRIDQSTSDGGTSSTGNVAGRCFSNEYDFVFFMCSLIPTEFRDDLTMIHTKLSAILHTKLSAITSKHEPIN